MTEEEALSELSDLCQPDCLPQLSTDELTRVLRRFARWTVHAVETAYTVGQRVAPAVPNGRMYICIAAGTSGEEIPSWPSRSTGYAGRSVPYIVSDGDTLRWQDDGPAFPEQYDIGGAAQAAWMMKAAKSAHFVNMQEGPQKMEMEKAHLHCKAMAAAHSPLFVE